MASQTKTRHVMEPPDGGAKLSAPVKVDARCPLRWKSRDDDTYALEWRQPNGEWIEVPILEP